MAHKSSSGIPQRAMGISWPSSSSNMFASAGYDGAIRIWERSCESCNWTLPLTLRMRHDLLEDLAISDDGAVMLAIGRSTGRLFLFSLLQQSPNQTTTSCALACGVFHMVEASWVQQPWRRSAGGEPALSLQQQIVASALGWNASSWNACRACRKGSWGNGTSAAACVQDLYMSRRLCPASQLKLWSQLSASEQAAAVSLGYLPGSWDGTSPFSCCYSDPLPAPFALDELDSCNTLSLQGKDLNTSSPTVKLPSLLSTQPPLATRVTVLHQEQVGVGNSVDFAPGNHQLAAGFHGGVRIFNFTQGTDHQVLGLPGDGAADVRFSPDGRLLGVMTHEGQAYVWDMQPPIAVHSIQARMKSVYGIGFSPDDGLLVSAAGNQLRFYTAAPGPGGGVSYSENGSISIPGNGLVNDLAYSPGGRLVGMAVRENQLKASPGSLRLLDVAEERWLPALHLASNPTWANGIGFSADGSCLAGGFGDDTSNHTRGIAVWSTADLEAKPLVMPTAVPVYGVGLSAGCEYVAAGLKLGDGAEGPAAGVWRLDREGGQLLAVPQAAELLGRDNFGITARWAPRRMLRGQALDLLAVGYLRATDRKNLKVLYGDFSRPESLQVVVLLGHRNIIWHLDWSPDGTLLASVAEDARLIIWDMSQPSQGRILQKIPLRSPGTAVSWSRDGSKLAVGHASDGSLTVLPFTPLERMSATLRGLILPFTPQTFETFDATYLDVPQEVFAQL